MRCTKAKKWISRYIDGELDTRRTAALERHLSNCPGCRETAHDLRRIVETAGRVEDPVPPGGGWSEVCDRLESAPASFPKDSRTRNLRTVPVFRLVAAAATMFMVFVGGMLLGPEIFQRNRGVFALPDNQEYTLSKLEEAEIHYQRAIRALAEAAESRDGWLDPQLAEVFRANLALINSSIETCKQAVSSDPSDLESRKYLLAAYRKKADLLNRIINISGGPSRAGKDLTI